MQVYSHPTVTHTDYMINPKKQRLIKRALCCLEQQLQYESIALNNPAAVKDYVRLHLGNEINEVFAVLFLNNQHQLLAFEKLFFGSIHTTTVHPRVIVQRALHFNAANIILAHNHPSGNVNPSKQDIWVTKELKNILAVIDVRVRDHIIVSSSDAFSFEENALFT